MSGYLAGKVWHSDLDPDLKPLAATLADIGDDDGSNIYPSIAFVAWRLGRTDNAVRTGIHKLRDMGVLSVVEEGGGRGKPTEYQMVSENLPERPSWASRFSDKPSNPLECLDDINPPVDERVSKRKHSSLAAKHSSLEGKTLQPTGVNPSLPVHNPSVLINRGNARQDWGAFAHRFLVLANVAVKPNKSNLESYERVCRELGPEEVLRRLEWWLGAQGDIDKNWVVRNFFKEVSEFVPPTDEELAQARSRENGTHRKYFSKAEEVQAHNDEAFDRVFGRSERES